MSQKKYIYIALITLLLLVIVILTKNALSPTVPTQVPVGTPVDEQEAVSVYRIMDSIAPESNFATTDDQFVVTGQFPGKLIFTIKTVQLETIEGETFFAAVDLQLGTNEFYLALEDAAGNKVERNMLITRTTTEQPADDAILQITPDGESSDTMQIQIKATEVIDEDTQSNAHSPDQQLTIPSIPTPSADQTAVLCDGSDFQTQFLCLINEYRATNSLQPLSIDTALNNTAQQHAQWMFRTDTLSHIGDHGTNPSDRCMNNATVCHAENVAYGATMASDILSMWQASPPHNDNLLGMYNSIGIAIAGTYSAAVFAY